MGPELAGIVIAAVTIDTLAERRQVHERKAQLIRQLGSKYRDVTEMAIIELKHKGWLEDGSLSGANLSHANLSGADLQHANPSEAILWGADLTGASLSGANLSRANLEVANLSGAFLWRANLSEADLSGADLTGTKLVEANLSGVNLYGARLSQVRLTGSNLTSAKLDGCDLSGISLHAANMHQASLNGANLSRADLSLANLSWAFLWGANLSGTTGLTIQQLEQAATLETAFMPDQVRLGSEGWVEGPTFEEWKAQFLAKYGRTDKDIMDAIVDHFESNDSDSSAAGS